MALQKIGWGLGRDEKGASAKSSIIPSAVLACFAAKMAREFASRKNRDANAHAQLAIACVGFAHMDEKMGVGARPHMDLCRGDTLLRQTLWRLPDWDSLWYVCCFYETVMFPRNKQSTHKDPSQ